MAAPRPVLDPSVKVGINMPASALQRLQDYARAHNTSVSELCRAGALRQIEGPAEPHAER